MSQVVQIPNEVPALLNYAWSALLEHQYANAVQACQAALNLDCNQVDAHHCLSHAYRNLGQVDLSNTMLKRALQLEPMHPQLNYNAAVEAARNGDEQRAMLHYQQALRGAPDMADALWNYGEHLRMGEHFKLALGCFERLLALGQDHYSGLWHRMAVCYAALDRHQEAQAMWQRALAGEHDVLSHWEYSFYLLSIEDYLNGTRFYNDRFSCGGRNSVFQHDFPFPLWDGVFTDGLNLLLHGEQGLGDEIMFASMFNELIDEAEKANAQVIIGCKPGLVRLFANSFPKAVVRAHKVGETPIDLEGLKVDAQMAMGHLMARYRSKVANFTAHRHAYLKPEPKRVAYYAQRLDDLGRSGKDGKKRMRVGLMWASNPIKFTAKFSRWAGQKSIALPLFAPFCDFLDDVEFVSLQNIERGAESALLPGLNLIDFSQDQDDFYDTAAIAANLDLVISVDTSVCHLTGSMAIDTWVPLIYRADWRYGRVRQDSLWYDKTRLFRQAKADHWLDVLQHLHEALRLRIAQWKENQ